MANIAIPTTGTVISTTAFGIPVATELNTRCVKIDGTRGDGTVMQMTGDLLLRNANPSNDNHAARKKYVDDQIGARVAVAGDVMTGTLTINEADSPNCLVMRTQATTSGSLTNNPYLAFMNNTASVQYGIMQGSPAGLLVRSDIGDLTLHGDDEVNVTAASDINLTAPGNVVIAATGVVRSGELRVSEPSRIFGTTPQTLILGGIGSSAYLGFYSDATNVDTLGTRSGYIGFSASNSLTIVAELASSQVIVEAPHSVAFKIGGTAETARIAPALSTFASNIRATVAPTAATAVTAQLQASDSRTVAGSQARVGLFAGTAAAQLRVTQSVGDKIEVVSGSGSGFVDLVASGFVESSAANTKTDITDASGSMLELMRSVPVKQFRRPRHGDTPGEIHNDRPKLGMMADTVAAALPGVAHYDPDGKPDGWEISQMVAVVFAAVVELAAKVEAL